MAEDLGPPQFLVRDATLFEGGDTNLYAYVRNDPVNFLDPGGKVPVPVLIVGGAGFGILYYNIAPNVQACLESRNNATQLYNHAANKLCGSEAQLRLKGLADRALVDAARYCWLAGYNLPVTPAQGTFPTSKADLLPLTTNNHTSTY